MRKVFKVIVIVLIIVLVKLISSFAVNEMIIKDYNNGKYDETMIKFLYLGNLNQPYVVYYNNGNILYKMNEFDKAISKYKEALIKNPPRRKTCDIRINLSLAMIKNISSDDQETVFNLLEDAKQNLYNDGCANANDDNGRSKEAENLEEEIKKAQEQITGNPQGKPDTDDPNKPDQKDDPDKDIEQKLKDIEKQGNQNRQGDLDNSGGLDEGGYYNGKKW